MMAGITPAWARQALLAVCTATIAGCGDVGFVFAVRNGTVMDNAACSGAGGSFGLRDQQGLTVLVVITEDTNVFFASGGSASCGDITKGAAVEVRGDDEDGTMNAESVRLTGGPLTLLPPASRTG